jgi:activator of HSP90 ATPase
MPDIELHYYIMAPVSMVWQALVDPDKIRKWGGGPAEMSDEPGYAFKLWGGDIHGVNSTVVKESKLVQDWISGDWKEPSRLTITMKQDGDQTRVDLFQQGVPDDEYTEVRSGWDEYYFGPLKRWVESENH